MAQTQSIDLHEILQRIVLEAHATWHYRWYALILAWVIAIVGALLVFALPNQYQASAQVYADTDALMNPLLRGISVQPDLSGRLDIITHTLLSRPNLETVADQTGLALRATTPASKDALLTALGAAVKIKDAGAKNLYNLTYADTDPKMAQKVVQAFLQVLMTNTLGANSQSTATAQNFLQQQVDDYGQRLNTAEKKLADFEKANVGFLPSRGGGDYFTQIQQAKSALQVLEANHQAALDAPRGSVKAVAPSAPRVQQLNKQIDGYQQHLSTLLLSYTSEYPDVVSTKHAIAELTAQRTALESGDVGKHATAGEAPQVAVSHRSGTHAFAAQIALKKKQIADLQANLGQVANAQVTLHQLSRDYDATKLQYNQLVTRLNTAQLSQDAAQSGNNLKFRVINPPFAPPAPVSPKRGLLLLVTFVFAVGIGGAFAYFLHLIKPVFVSLKSLRDFSDFPVIGAVGLIVSPRRRARRRREILGFCAGVGLMAVVMVAGLGLEGHIARAVQHVFTLGAL